MFIMLHTHTLTPRMHVHGCTHVHPVNTMYCDQQVLFFICFFSWKTAEKLFLDAMEKIKAIGNEVAAHIREKNYISVIIACAHLVL